MPTFADTYQTQFRFHFEETRRLLDLARAVPEAAFRAPDGYSQGSMYATFAHLLGADLFWRSMLQNAPLVDLGPEEIPGMPGLLALLESERGAWKAMIAGMDDAALFSTFQRQTPYGEETFVVWKVLQHVILHGMQHHTELARMLTEAGQDPGDIELLDY